MKIKEPFGVREYAHTSDIDMKVVGVYLPLPVVGKLALRSTVDGVSLSHTAALMINDDAAMSEYSEEEMIDILVSRTVKKWEHEKELYYWGSRDLKWGESMEVKKAEYTQSVRESLGKRGLTDNDIEKIIYKTGL